MCVCVNLHPTYIISLPDAAYLEFLNKSNNFQVMRRCDDCSSDAIDLSSNRVPFGQFYHTIAHVSAQHLPLLVVPDRLINSIAS